MAYKTEDNIFIKAVLPGNRPVLVSMYNVLGKCDHIIRCKRVIEGTDYQVGVYYFSIVGQKQLNTDSFDYVCPVTMADLVQVTTTAAEQAEEQDNAATADYGINGFTFSAIGDLKATPPFYDLKLLRATHAQLLRDKEYLMGSRIQHLINVELNQL